MRCRKASKKRIIGINKKLLTRWPLAEKITLSHIRHRKLGFYLPDRKTLEIRNNFYLPFYDPDSIISSLVN